MKDEKPSTDPHQYEPWQLLQATDIAATFLEREALVVLDPKTLKYDELIQAVSKADLMLRVAKQLRELTE